MPLPFSATVLAWVGSLFSKVELSGTKTDPAVPVKTCGVMFASAGAMFPSVTISYAACPAGMGNPSEQTAKAKFWVRNVVATAIAVIRRMRRPVLCCVVIVFALTLIFDVIPNDHVFWLNFDSVSPSPPVANLLLRHDGASYLSD
jgi:hypothetical protein